MATITHVRGDTLPLTQPLPAGEAIAATLQVHAVASCVEIEGTIARGRASFPPEALDALTPGRAYRTTTRITWAGGAVQTIDSFAVLILEGCGAPQAWVPIHIIDADTIITANTIIQEAV